MSEFIEAAGNNGMECDDSKEKEEEGDNLRLVLAVPSGTSYTPNSNIKQQQNTITAANVNTVDKCVPITTTIHLTSTNPRGFCKPAAHRKSNDKSKYPRT